jgi:hypothetical protein
MWEGVMSQQHAEYAVRYLPLPLDLDALVSPTRRTIILNSKLNPHRLTRSLRQVLAYVATAAPPGPQQRSAE